jgi:hypothetical protein|tara:strand:- start:27 stop:521 length:495 start_codon:yes stop_codon:yes gene_type:complete
MRHPHPNTHLVEAVIKEIGVNPVSIISARFQMDYPQAEIPSPRTIASIKKRMETPEASPSNLCKGCMGYGYLYEQTKTYFGDGTESNPTLGDKFKADSYVEISCPNCDNSGIDPNWERPRSRLQSVTLPSTTPHWEAAKTYPSRTTEGVTITEQIEVEPLERTL